MTRRRVVLAVLAVLALVALGAALCWRATAQPIVTDEIEFFETGPALWRGEHPLSCAGRGWEELLHHPTAYHLLLGAIAATSGGELAALPARLPGIVALFVGAAFAGAFARRWLGSSSTPGIVAAVALVLCSPLALQGALLVDIDTTVLMAGVLAFLYLACGLAEQQEPSGPATVGLGVAFAALLWIKLPTPVMALAALTLAVLLTPGRRRLLLHVATVAAVGALLFAATWSLFCRSQGLDALAPIEHLSGRGVARASVSLLTLGKRALRLLLWLGPWLPAAAAASAAALWREGGPGRLARRILLAFALVVLPGYLWLGGEAFGFPRYHMPLVACLAAMAARGFAPSRSAAGLGLGTLAYLLLVGDPLLPAYTFAESVALGDTSAAQAARDVGLRLALWLAPALTLPLLPRLRLERRSALVTLALACGVATSAHQLLAPYSTHYMYGERGQHEARALLAVRSDPAQLTLAPKDLAFRVLPCGSYVYSNRSLSSGLAAELLERGELALLVLRAGDLADARARHTLARPEVRRILATEFAYRRSGDFLFYERRGAR